MNSGDKENLVAHKLQKAKDTINEARLLIENKMWNAAVSRLYYACFYAANALLTQNDIKARKHSGVIQMLGLHFIGTGLITKDAGRFFSIIFDMRQSGDYIEYISFEENDVVGLLTPAIEFINEIEEVLKRQPHQ